MTNFKNQIACIRSDKNWIKDVQRYRSEGEWISVVEKFAVAVFRLLRIKQKELDWLAQEMGMSTDELRSQMKGKAEITLKTLVKIQSLLGEELISVKNVDLSAKYRECRFVVIENDNSYKAENIERKAVEGNRTECLRFEPLTEAYCIKSYFKEKVDEHEYIDIKLQDRED
ncbi:hypothetical protein [Parabacteroides sp.]